MDKIKNKIEEIKNNMTPAKVLVSSIVLVILLSVIGISWAWFSALDTGGDLQGVTVETANLSIVFTDTNKLELLNAIPGQSASKTFTVQNTGDKTAKYSINWAILTNGFPTKSDLVYKIESTNQNMSYMMVPETGTHINIINNISIEPNTTHTYTITILFKNRNANQSENQGASMTGKLEVSEEAIKQIDENNTFANVLKTNNTPVNSPATTPGRQKSTTDEGLITGPNDDYGNPTYYFRGNVTDNYVFFATKTWRVVRINGDGSVRMILDGSSGSTGRWNGTKDSTTNLQYVTYDYDTMVGWLEYDNTSLKSGVETWYNRYIGKYDNYAKKVSIGKFCSDRTHTGNTNPVYFGAYNRLYATSSALPQFTCPNSSDIINTKVGLITADEVAFAGGVNNTSNNKYYLKSGSNYWTMSPYGWNSDKYVSGYNVVDDGNLSYSDVSWSFALRPVISLNPNVTVTLDYNTTPGAWENPYIVN